MKTTDLTDLSTEQVLKLLSARDSVAACRTVALQLLDGVTDADRDVIEFIAQAHGQIAANTAGQKFYNGDHEDAAIFRMLRAHSDTWQNVSHWTAAGRRHAYDAMDPDFDPCIEYRAQAQAAGL